MARTALHRSWSPPIRLAARLEGGQDFIAVKETIEVTVRTLDSLEELPVPDVIKIDAEGSEIEVLRGASGLLQRHRPTLLIELHGTNEGVARELERAGYLGRVLGGACNIEQASWTAHVLAVPKEG